MTHGLPRKIRFVFIVQALLGSVVITVGVLIAMLVVRHAVLEDRMQREASLFWAEFGAQGDHAMPKASGMSVYLDRPGAPDPDLPLRLRGARPGLHWLPTSLSGLPRRSIYIDSRPEGTVYLTFETRHLDRAIAWTGLVSLLLALSTTLLISWLTYRISQRLVAPVSRLAYAVSRWDPRDPDIGSIHPHTIDVDAGDEVQHLSQALVGLADRIGDFVERERDFTRDASHELRTPLTVIRVATDMLIDDPETSARALRSLERVQRANRDMEAVIDAFLILARDVDIEPQCAEFDVIDIVRGEVERVRPLLLDKPVVIEILQEGAPRLFAPPNVLNVMLRNLLGNAVGFTERGSIQVRVGADRIEVQDTGVGMSPETLAKAFEPFYRAGNSNEESKGMGLSIVHRLGDRFGWPVTLTSQVGAGTTAVIRFSA